VEELRRFDVAVHGSVAMVVVESALLPPDPAVVVIPLLRGYPAVRDLNPTIVVEGEQLILATRLICAARRASLKRADTVSEQGDAITRAVDVLMSGV